MGSPSTRMSLLMLFVCFMARLLLIYLPTVLVAKPFQLIMHSAVHTVLIPSSAIMIFVILVFSEACHDVQIEPHLPPLTGEILHNKSAEHADDARVAIRAAGFRGCRHHRSFLMFVYSMSLLRAISPPV